MDVLLLLIGVPYFNSDGEHSFILIKVGREDGATCERIGIIVVYEGWAESCRESYGKRMRLTLV